MDYPSYRPSTRSQDTAGGSSAERQASIEERISETPRYLQKKSSYPNLRYNEPSRVGQAQPPSGPDRLGSSGLGEGTKARKGSLRYAVRRLFGRRSREPEPQPSQASPPRRIYHASETSGLIAQDDLSPGRTRDSDLMQRTRSTPISSVPVTDIQRTRSPYAMQFPHSARLKPLDLGNPFAAPPPAAQLRRRQTLPSVQISDSDATILSASLGSPSKSRGHVAMGSWDTSIAEVESPASKRKREKRRSRSAGDLRTSQKDIGGSPPQRGEDMRLWRDSLQGSVLRASGFRAQSSSTQTAEKERTPTLRPADLFDSERANITPASQRDVSTRDLDFASGYGTDLSQELEARITRLERNLQDFRGQLNQLSTDRNRRTVLIGGVDTRSRAASGGRTASILATDLQQDIGPSNYQYDYSRNVRPSASPPPPRTPTRTDPSSVAPAFSFGEPVAADDPFVSPPRAPNISTGGASGANPGMPPQYTFRSLYEMLADERSARRKLESQLKVLSRRIEELHQQVSLQSNIQSQRSSYYAPPDPMIGSSRLHALLQGTETSPPSTAQSQMQRDSQRYSAEQQGLVSRFSASESEMGGTVEELQTPHDAYQTPLEEQGRFPFTEDPRTRGAMF